MSEFSVHLRPFQEGDLQLLARFATDPASSAPYVWSGFRSLEGIRRRWEEDGFLDRDPHYLAVAQPDETVIGSVTWRDPTSSAGRSCLGDRSVASSRVSRPGCRHRCATSAC